MQSKASPKLAVSCAALEAVVVEYEALVSSSSASLLRFPSFNIPCIEFLELLVRGFCSELRCHVVITITDHEINFNPSQHLSAQLC